MRKLCSMKKNLYLKSLKKDLPAGLVVFLVALPLCLGIALASGAPMFSGIIAGIIGGVVIGFLSGSHTSVSGPAAGLIIIVLSAITTLGSYEAFLLSLVLAGVIQLLLGLLKAGVVSLYFPSNVIKGMLAAIGLTLILKQIPHFLGVDGDDFGEMEFFQKDGNTTFSYLAEAFEDMNFGVMITGAISFVILLLWESKWVQRVNALKQIPGALVAVLFGVLTNLFYMFVFPDFTIAHSHLVALPSFKSLTDIGDSLVFPDFSALSNYQVYVTALTLAFVASLETLLSLEAVDKLDPQKRVTPQNRELMAQGAGNILSGLIGGLPITAVIVRSSANINAGSKTKLSGIFHGVLLIFAVLVFAKYINYIPLSSLAAILILVGFKLTKPALYIKQFKLGLDQFIPFVVTVLAIMMSDLLIGIGIGMAVGIFYILKANFKIPYFYAKDTEGDGTIHITLSEHVSFLNKPSLQTLLSELPEKSKVVVDGSKAQTIDYDALDTIHRFKALAREKHIHLELKNIPDLEVQGDLH